MDRFQQLKVLSDSTRFKILQRLVSCEKEQSHCEYIKSNEDGCCVGDLILATGLSQPTVSHHLKTLTAAGLVIREKRGTYACYFANPREVKELATWLQNQLLSPDDIKPTPEEGEL